MANLSLKSSESATGWMQKAKELSDEAYQAMKDTAQIVEEIKSESAGTLADEMVSLANTVLKQAEKVTSTMETISSVIKDIFSKVSDFVDKMKGFIFGASSNM